MWKHAALPIQNVLTYSIPMLVSPDSDSGSLLKIQDTVHSYKRLIELKNSHCKALLGKLGTVKNEVSGLHKKLSDAEHEKIKREQELCNLRYDISTLKMSKG